MSGVDMCFSYHQLMKHSSFPSGQAHYFLSEFSFSDHKSELTEVFDWLSEYVVFPDIQNISHLRLDRGAVSIGREVLIYSGVGRLHVLIARTRDDLAVLFKLRWLSG
jgi:hypothetical protein